MPLLNSTNFSFFACSGVFHLFPVKKPEIKGKGGLHTGTSWLKKQSRKIALKRRKRQLFGTDLDRNLVKTATFWDKVRTMNFHSTYPPLILQFKLMNILALSYYLSPNLKRQCSNDRFFLGLNK